MGWFGMERKREEVQLRWLLFGGDEVLEGRGERRREEELEEGGGERREKERLLMEMMECVGEHWIWKEGWPQPGAVEKGKERAEVVNGGHGVDCSGFEQG